MSKVEEGKSKLKEFWDKLLPFIIGQRVRVISILPCPKTSWVTQGGFNLDFRGEEGTVIMLYIGVLGEGANYLVQFDSKKFTLDNRDIVRDRIWCSPEELEIIE